MKTNPVTGVVRGSLADRAAFIAAASPGKIYQLDVSPFALSVCDGLGGSQEYYPSGGDTIFGTLGVPSALNPVSGDRPLASSVPHGTLWAATDSPAMWMSVPHPFNPLLSIWRIVTGTTSVRQVLAVVTGAINAINLRMGVYDRALGTFTPASVIGQSCNATAAANGVVGVTIPINIIPAAANILVALTLGAEFMVDGITGSAIPYDGVAPHVALGYGNQVTAALANVNFYDF